MLWDRSCPVSCLLEVVIGQAAMRLQLLFQKTDREENEDSICHLQNHLVTGASFSRSPEIESCVLSSWELQYKEEETANCKINQSLAISLEAANEL